MSTFKTSANHKFNLPDYTDAADVKQLSENWAKVDKALKQVATYYNSNTNFNLDTATDSIVLIPKSFSKDCPIASGSGFIYVSQHFFGEISATSNRTQIAFSYGDNALGGMAIRHYYGGTWSKWCKFYCVDDKPTPAEIGAMPDGIVPIIKGGTGADGYNQAQINLKVLSRLAMYYSPTDKPDIDTITDSLILIPYEYSKNCPVGGSFVYIMQLFYGDITASSKRTQIAFPYMLDGTVGKSIAVRSYADGTWSEWDGLASISDHQIKSYTSLADIGITAGQETIEDIAQKLGTWSELLCATTSGNAAIYPDVYGTLRVTSVDSSRVVFRWVSKDAKIEYTGTYSFSNATQWSGWHKVHTTAQPIAIEHGGTGGTDVPTARRNLGFIQGSYNGDGTSNLRIFNIAGDRGDIGNALLIWSSNETMKAIITPEGGTVWYDDGAWAAVSEDDDLGSRERICYFKGGKLYLEVKNVLIGTPYRDLLNKSGVTYYYQVL